MLASCCRPGIPYLKGEVEVLLHVSLVAQQLSQTVSQLLHTDTQSDQTLTIEKRVVPAPQPSQLTIYFHAFDGRSKTGFYFAVKCSFKPRSIH